MAENCNNVNLHTALSNQSIEQKTSLGYMHISTVLTDTFFVVTDGKIELCK
jgi:hypothetical protein